MGKKFLPKLNHPYPATKVKWSTLRGWGRNGFNTLVNDIHQQNGWRAFIKTKVLHFNIENTPIKDTNGKFKRMENWIRSIKFGTVRIFLLSDVFGLLSSKTFASMATWRDGLLPSIASYVSLFFFRVNRQIQVFKMCHTNRYRLTFWPLPRKDKA